MSKIAVEKLDGGLWSLRASYFSRALIANAKAVPGMRYEPSNHSWRGHVDAVRATCARLKLQGVGVADEELPAPEAWRDFRSGHLISTKDLRPYQVEGVQFLLARAKEGALLADGMRLGKSAQSLIAARAFKAKTLVVCPSHVVGVWGRARDDVHGAGEIAKWWPEAWRGVEGSGIARDGRGVVCLETVKPAKASPDDIKAFAGDFETAQVIVCHYDILYAWVEVLLLWDFETLILDELHICAGYKSRRANALKTLRAHAKYTIGLTGTPITNLPKHTHNVLEILSPLRFGYFFLPDKADGTERSSYARLFCESHQETVGKGETAKTIWKHDGRLNLDTPDGTWALTKEETLSERLKYLMLRRLKRDVDPQLPQKTRQVVDVTIPARHCIGVSSTMLGGKGDGLREILNAAADGKLRHVVDLVAGHVAEDEKVLCFCYRRLFAEQVAKDLKKKVGDALVMFVHGGLTQKERDRRINALRKHDGPGVLACTIDTTSTGIDLSFASVAVFGELTWEHHELAQAEERCYKFGVDNKTLIQYVIARGTGDELILRAVIDKLDTAERAGARSEDAMKEDLAGKKEGGMKRLYEALLEMQKAPTKTVKGKGKRRVRA